MRNLFTLIGIGAVVLLLLFTSLPGCAPAAEKVAYENYVSSLPAGCEPVPPECFEQAQQEGELAIYDWAEWWPEEAYTNFSEEFGIKIVRDNYASEPEVVAKFKLNPQMPYDMVTGMATEELFKLRELGVVQEINHDWLPNVSKYMPKEFAEYESDPGAKYSIFTDYGFNAYWYNTKYVDDPRIPSWAVVFKPEEKYKGRITLVDDMDKTIANALSYLGYPVDSDDEEQLMEVKALMLGMKPYIMTFDSWPKRLALEEEGWICASCYGDGFMIHQENEDITADPPLEGARLASEIMFIPKAAPHPAVAHLWMNYVWRPQVSALIMGVTGWAPANPAAVEFLPPALAEWYARVPEGYLAKCQVMGPRAITGKGRELRMEIWEELKR